LAGIALSPCDGHSGPEERVDHQDRIADCEIALEPVFQAIAVEAVGVGWTEDDVIQGMLNLSVAQLRNKASTRRKDATVGLERLVGAMQKDQFVSEPEMTWANQRTLDWRPVG
jgi:hypothetical protein